MFRFVCIAIALAVPAAGATQEGARVKLSGYVEYHENAMLVVEGQKVAVNGKTKFKGTGALAQIPTRARCTWGTAAAVKRSVTSRPKGSTHSFSIWFVASRTSDSYMAWPFGLISIFLASTVPSAWRWPSTLAS